MSSDCESITVTYRVQINTEVGWRAYLGNRLRSLAWWIDGRITLAISVESDPPLAAEQKIECIAQALAAIERAASAEVIDHIRRKQVPHLYRSER